MSIFRAHVRHHFVLFLTLACAGIGVYLFSGMVQPKVSAWQSGTVAVVSAASYDTNVAPDSIAALFGTNLASTTARGGDTDVNAPGVQLPTTLAGVSVEIGGIAAGLFGVSPGQINLHISPNVALGTQNVVVRNGSTTVGTGTVQIVNVAPGIFSYNATGSGVAAGLAVRIRNNAALYEEIATFSVNKFITKAIDLGPVTDQVYLSLYGTGFRRAAAGAARVALGGVEYTPQYAGAQGSFLGLDQLNLLIPRSLLGTGRVNVTLNAMGATPANVVEIEVAGQAGNSNITVTNPTAPVVAADAITINGSGFAGQPSDNVVRIGGIEAQVLSGTTTALNVRVPYGAETGAVSVRTAQGEGRSTNAMQVRTSISGVVETTDRQPLSNVKVRGLVGLTLFDATTGTGGTFVLSELPGTSAAALVTIDGGSINTTPAYGSLTLNQNYLTLRDNQFASPIALQQVTGTSGQVGGGGSLTGTPVGEVEEPLSLTTDVFASPKELPPALWPAEWSNAFQPIPDDAVIRLGDVTLTLPGGINAFFADGSNRGLVTLTQVESSRTPVSLPAGVFSAVIMQITPFGTTFNPGGTLRFPNPERYAAGTRMRVYRLDQRRNSLTIGRFIQSGFATVSQDGQSIVTDAGVVTEATYYFVALPRTIANVVGRVLDANRSPLRNALVRLRGQESFTDGNGGFTLRNVPVADANDLIIVEASFARANGRVDRAFSNRTAPVLGGFTNVGDILMPAANTNQPPALVVATLLNANAGQTNDFNFLAYDPDEARVPGLSVSGARFAAIVPPTANTPPILRLTPTSTEVGTFTLTLTATDSQNAVTTRTITVRVTAPNRAPTANALRVITDEDTPIQFTLTGSDPDQNQLKFLLGSRPANGILTGTFPTLTYTPNRDFNGNDSFTFRVSDGQLDSALATVSLVVNAVNDAPVLTVPGTQNVNVGQTVNFTISATDLDAGQTLTYSATNLPTGATFTAATRQFSWTPSVNQVGTFSVTFTVIDNGTPARSDAKSVTLNVTGNGIWQQTNGPTGGSVSALAVSGTAVIAATLEGFMFRSTDGGASWKEVNQTGNFETIWELVATGAKLYALTSTRVYVSNDNGATWTTNTATYPAGVIISLAANGNNVFAGILTEPLQASGVYRSTDGGQTWSLAHTGLTHPIVTALAVSGTTLIAGTNVGTVFRSTNNGTQWGALNVSPGWEFIDAAVVNGTNFYLAGDSFVMRSTDSGANFSAFGNLGSSDASSLFIDGATLYAGTLDNGVYRIDGNGATALGTQGLATLEVSDVVVTGTSLLASNLATGVYRSTNGGQSWSAANVGFIGSLVTSMATGGGFVFGGLITNSDLGLGAVARTNDAGKTWTMTLMPNPDAYVTALAYGNNALIAGWQGTGLFRSSDNGANFTPVATTSGVADTRSLLANGATMFCGTGTGIFRSTDSGVNWSRVYTSTGPVISLSLVGTTLYAGVAGQTGGLLYRSTDNGANWVSVNLAQAVTNVVQVGSTLIASAIPNQNAPAGIYRSTDNGASWTAANNGLLTSFVFKLVPVGTAVYAATGAGVYVTTNSGQTWTAFNDGLRNLLTASMVLNGSMLYVGTGGSGVWSRVVAQ